ncbi:CvpA family protein [Moraxella pluranimalium]|uniref:Colicin V production protein n=1 Tax=Moraxella pluranimalium TaxID=470453 RepID=A0A1T0CQL7_9GAMM|nr:CvpA family protein [Moraxella pluranimalium]OOS24633.1 colicin V production protein [Moraxella pluranimalium]
MAWLDIIITFVVFMGLWRGFRAGVIKTLAALVSWLLALIIASKMADDFAYWFVGITDSQVLQIAMAFLAVMLAVVVGVQLIASTLTKTVSALKLGFLDRLAGGVLGAGVGVLKVLIVLSIIAPLLLKVPSVQNSVQNSVLVPALLPYAPVAKTLLQETLGQTWNQLENPYK